MKIKYINYKPYEHALLQSKLDKLGEQGYDCSDLSMISIFRKKDHPVYYKVEFFLSKEKEKYKQHKDIAKYYEQHTLYGFFPIYSKNGMYVFAGNEDHTFNTTEYSNGIQLAEKRISNIFLLLCGAILLTLMLYYALFATQPVTAFLTYGKPIAYIGILLLCISFIYRLYNDFHYSNAVKHGGLPLDKIKKTHKIAMILLFVSVVLIGGGLIEDSMNIKEFSYDSHPYINLSNFGFQDYDDKKTSSAHGFIIKNSYTAYQSINDIAIYTKEYDFNSAKQANRYIQSLIKRPYEVISTKIVQKDGMYYGYYNDTLNTIILNEDKKVIIVTYSEELNDEIIQTIKNFYF